MSGVEGRFWSKVDKESSPHGCWLWTACGGSYGCGQIRIDGKVRLAHRMAWELTRGAIPAGMQLDHFRMNSYETRHTCSRRCVNPEHLELVTSAENTRRSEVLRTRSRTNGLRSRKHDLPEGVTLNRARFQAQMRCALTKRVVKLGTFDTPAEAHSAYLEARRAH